MMDDYFPPDENTQPFDQAHPHNREAEEAVLGSVLINPESYFDLAQILQADDFYIVRNRWIWEAFVRLQDRRSKIDYLTVGEELDGQGQLFEIGGPAYITALISQTPSSLHAEAYARLVVDSATRRRMLTAANEMAQMALDTRRDMQTLLDDAEKAVFSLSDRRTKTDLQPISKLLHEFYEHIDQMAQRDESIFGVLTGLVDLDKWLGGMQKSDLLIVAGRPGMGKTGFLLSAAKVAAQRYKKHVAIFSLEMSSEQVVQRLVSQETGIDIQKLRSGKLSEDEMMLFTHAMDVLGEQSIWIDETPGITPMQLRTKCRRLHMEHQLDLVVVDYLQLMAGDMHTDNRVQEVSFISRHLKGLAKELNVPVLTAAQLSRAVEQRTDKRPQLSDLRESGSLEQDADIVMFIHRPEALDKDHPRHNIAEIIIGKHRNGPTHSGIEVIFRDNMARFDNANRE